MLTSRLVGELLAQADDVAEHPGVGEPVVLGGEEGGPVIGEAAAGRRHPAQRAAVVARVAQPRRRAAALDDEGQDPRPSANTSAAALYALADPESKTLQPVGVYNDGRIVVRGWHVEHWLAGKKVVDVDLSTDEMKQRIAASKFAAWSGFAKSDRGLLVLQDHGDEVWYRSIRVRDLTEDKEKKGGDGR